MFLPRPAPILPKLIKARVPVWVLAAAIVAQAAINTVGKPDEPMCSLKLERLHHSTSVNEKTGKDAIKLNITSECTSEQLKTQLTVEIFTLRNGREVSIYTSDPAIQIADKKDRKKAIFLDFWVECIPGRTELYRGIADGIATLQDGRNIHVSGNTGNYLAVKCQSKAK